MLSELQREMVLAVLADATLDAIDATIINPAPIDEDEKAALWLYAEALLERRRDAILTKRDLIQLVS